MSTDPAVDAQALAAREGLVDPARLDEHRDMAPGQPLLGVPSSTLLRPAALRGLAMLVIAAAVLLWPSRTEGVLAVLVGIGLAVQAATTIGQVVRHPGQRRFSTMLSISVLAGLAAALVLHPDESLVSVARVMGVGLLLLAARSVRDSLGGRAPRTWAMLKGVALGLAGGLLLAFPAQVVVVVVSVAAGLVGIYGVLEIFGNVAQQQRAGGNADGVDRDDAVAGDPRGDDASDPSGAGMRARRVGDPVLQWLQHRPDMTEDRVDLMAKVYFEGRDGPTRYARFLALMAFASVIASVGVVVESTAVVIGAMLIAPLMTPLMATALSVPFGWPRRLRRSAGIALSGITLAIIVGALVGAMVPRTVDVASNTEILARISPTVVDLAIAVAAGAAGAYALARRDVSDSLPGVAVAIALVPPLTVVGLCWQQGEWSAGNGALLLFVTNGIAILLAGGLMFVLVGAAPIERISASQQRVQTALFGLVSLAIVVVMLLALNGTQLAQADLARADVEEVLADWSDANEDYRVLDVRVEGDGTIEVALAGPGQPPGIDQLVGDLRDRVGDVTVELSWTPQQQRVFPGG